MKVIALFFFLIILSACVKRSQYTQDDIDFLQNQINNRLKIFKRASCDSTLLFLKNNIITIQNRSDKIAEVFDNNNFYDFPAINDYVDLLAKYESNKFVQEQIEYFENKKYLNNDECYNIYNIKKTELILIDSLTDLYDLFFYHFRWVKPVVVANKNPIKPGEKFEGQIYIAGIFSKEEYSILINQDTISEILYDCIPVFRFMPTQKGSFKMNGRMVDKRGLINVEENWLDFDYTIMIE